MAAEGELRVVSVKRSLSAGCWVSASALSNVVAGRHCTCCRSPRCASSFEKRDAAGLPGMKAGVHARTYAFPTQTSCVLTLVDNIKR